MFWLALTLDGLVGYFGIGFVWSAYLFHNGRIEGTLGEIAENAALWPLDLLAWIERKFHNA